MYENNKLQFFNQPEGYVKHTNSNGYEYVYQYKDHLGNVRLSYVELVGSDLVVDSDFNSTSIAPWIVDPSATATIDNGRLKVDQTIPFKSVQVIKTLTAGKEYTLSFDVDLSELDGSFQMVVYSPSSGPILVEHISTSGSYTYNFTGLYTQGHQVIFRAWQLNSSSTFYLDNVSLTSEASLDIVEESNYYPFGLKQQGYNNVISSNGNSVAQKWGFQGQEIVDDLGLNVHEWKYRVGDPAIGRFWQIDPLAEDYVYNSTYAFAENKVISNFELEGLEAVSIHTASFAPFKTFGGPFKGDGANRRFTTNPNASSRISGQVNINATSTGIADRGSSATGSTSHNVITGGSTYSEADIKGGLSDNVNWTTGSNKVSAKLDFHLSGNNDLVPGSPDIDTKGAMTITREDLGDKGSVLNFSGKVFGDKFPSNETFITDSNGLGVFLGVSGADGNPLTSLPGNGNETMSTFNISVNFNAKGGITGVTYNGNNYSEAAWNKQFTELDPKDGNLTTNTN